VEDMLAAAQAITVQARLIINCWLCRYAVCREPVKATATLREAERRGLQVCCFVDASCTLLSPGAGLHGNIRLILTLNYVHRSWAMCTQTSYMHGASLVTSGRCGATLLPFALHASAPCVSTVGNCAFRVLGLTYICNTTGGLCDPWRVSSASITHECGPACCRGEAHRQLRPGPQACMTRTIAR
jgi:hypothetical protein